MTLPENIRNIIKDRACQTDTVGKSEAKVLFFQDMVLKIGCTAEEHEMMKWLSGKLPVPEVLAFEAVDGQNYLLMSRVKGEMLCSETYLERPETLVKLLTKSLKMLWAVDTADIPCVSSTDRKLEIARYRVENGLCDMEDAEPSTYGENGFKSPGYLLKWLKDNRPREQLVFSHGDLCLPNIFARDDEITGFIDLGDCGLADKYQDIALCYRSLKSNLSGKYGGRRYPDFDAGMLFEKLNITPDWDKLRYYLLLDELF